MQRVLTAAILVMIGSGTGFGDGTGSGSSSGTESATASATASVSDLDFALEVEKRYVQHPQMRCVVRVNERGIYVDGDKTTLEHAVAYCKQRAGAVVPIEPTLSWERVQPWTCAARPRTRSASPRS